MAVAYDSKVALRAIAPCMLKKNRLPWHLHVELWALAVKRKFNLGMHDVLAMTCWTSVRPAMTMECNVWVLDL